MIPEGWELTTIEKHIDLLSGFAFKSANYSSYHKDIPLLRGDNIEPGALRWRNCKRWKMNKLPGLEKYLLQEGDFVIAMDRTWVSAGLKIAEVKQSDLPCLLVQRVSRIRANKNFTQNLLKHIFSTHRFEQYVKSVQTETAIPHISAKQIREFTILVPPLEEQIKIANILSTWDKAIETVEKLIENSRALKKGLMQQLFTGKIRRNGETSDPVEYKLGKVCAMLRGKELSKDKLTQSGKYKCILYGELYTVYEDIVHEVVSTTNHNEGLISEAGDVLIPSSTTTSGIDLANAVSINEDGIRLGGDINVLRTNKNIVDSDFLAYLLTHHKKRDIAKLTQGITIIHLYGSDLKGVKITLPAISEQKYIASILILLDRHRFCLKKQLEVFQKQKTGLMQQLLTGKLRVNLDEADIKAASG